MANPAQNVAIGAKVHARCARVYLTFTFILIELTVAQRLQQHAGGRRLCWADQRAHRNYRAWVHCTLRVLISAEGLHHPLNEISIDDDALSHTPGLRQDYASVDFDACLEPPTSKNSNEDSDAEHLYPSRTVVRAIIGVCDAAAHNEGQLAQIAREFPAEAARIHKQWGSPSASEPLARMLVFSATEHHLEHATFFGPHCRFVTHRLHPPRLPGATTTASSSSNGADASAASCAAIAMHLRLEMSQICSAVVAQYGKELDMFQRMEDSGSLASVQQQLLAQTSSGGPSGSSSSSESPDFPSSAMESPAAAASSGGQSAATPAQLQVLSSVRCGRLDVGITHAIGSLSAAFGALKRRLNGRLLKHRADILLLMGSPHDAIEAADKAARALRSTGDWLFAGLSEETKAAALDARRSLDRRIKSGANGSAEMDVDFLFDDGGGDGSDNSPFQPAVAAALRDAVAHFDAFASSLGLGGSSSSGGASSSVAVSAANVDSPAASAAAVTASALLSPTSAGGTASPLLTDLASQLVVASRIRLASYLLLMAAPPTKALTSLCAVTGAAREDGGLLSWWGDNGLQLAQLPPSASGAENKSISSDEVDDNDAAGTSSLVSRGGLRSAALRCGSAAAAHERSRADATLLSLNASSIGTTTVDGKESSVAEVAAAVFLAQRTASVLKIINADTEPYIARNGSSRRMGPEGAITGSGSAEHASPSLFEGKLMSQLPFAAQTAEKLSEMRGKLSTTMKRAKDSAKEAAAAANTAISSSLDVSNLAASMRDMGINIGKGGGGGKEARPGPLEFSEALTGAVARAGGIRAPQQQLRALLLAADLYESSGLWRRADACISRACRLLRTLQPPLSAEAFKPRSLLSGESISSGPSGGCIYSLPSLDQPSAGSQMVSSSASPAPWPLPWLLSPDHHSVAVGGNRISSSTITTSLQPTSSSASASHLSLSPSLLVGPGWLRFVPSHASALLTLTSGLRDPALLARVLPLRQGERIALGRSGIGGNSGAGSGPRVLLPSSSIGEWAPSVLGDLWQCGELPLAAAVAAMVSHLASDCGALSDSAALSSEGDALRLPPSTSVLRSLNGTVCSVNTTASSSFTQQLQASPSLPATAASSSSTSARGPVASSFDPHRPHSSAASSTSSAQHPHSQLASALRRLRQGLHNRRALTGAASLSLYDASPLILVRSLLTGTTIHGRMSRLDALVALQLMAASAGEEVAASLHGCSDAPPASAAASHDISSTPSSAASSTMPDLRPSRLPSRPGGLLSALACDLCCVPVGQLAVGGSDADISAGSAVTAPLLSAEGAAPALASGAPPSSSTAAAGAPGSEMWRPAAFLQQLSAYMLSSSSSGIPHKAGAAGAHGLHPLSVQLVQRRLRAGSGTNSGTETLTSVRQLHVPFLPVSVIRLTSLSWRVVGVTVVTTTTAAITSPAAASDGPTAGVRAMTSPLAPSVPSAATLSATAASAAVPVPSTGATTASGVGSSGGTPTLLISDYLAAPPWAYSSSSSSSSSGSAGGGLTAAEGVILIEKENSGLRSRARMIDTSGAGTSMSGPPLALRTYAAKEPAEVLCVGLVLTGAKGSTGPLSGHIAVQLEVAAASAATDSSHKAAAPLQTMSSLVPFTVQPKAPAYVLAPVRLQHLPLASLTSDPAAGGSAPRILLRVTSLLVLCGPLMQQIKLELRPANAADGSTSFATSVSGSLSSNRDRDASGKPWDLDFTCPPSAASLSTGLATMLEGGGAAAQRERSVLDAPVAVSRTTSTAAGVRRGSGVSTSLSRAGGGAAAVSMPTMVAPPSLQHLIAPAAPASAGGGANTAALHSTGGIVVYGSSWAPVGPSNSVRGGGGGGSSRMRSSRRGAGLAGH